MTRKCELRLSSNTHRGSAKNVSSLFGRLAKDLRLLEKWVLGGHPDEMTDGAEPRKSQISDFKSQRIGQNGHSLLDPQGFEESF